MRQLSNNNYDILLRCLPRLIRAIDQDAQRQDIRLHNAVRQIKIIIRIMTKAK